MPFEDLFGNTRIKKILERYLLNQIIPYSLIFSGPASTSKRAFSLAFAKALNCTQAKNDFCDHCRHCGDINRFQYPDVIILSPDGKFYRKDQITFMIEENYKKPLIGDRKIFIIQDAHLMNENSANAFLKVLEEPTFTSIFILLTHNLNGLLSTIKSRCQILSFTPPSQNEIYNFLLKKGVEKEKAHLVSHLSSCATDPFILENLEMFLEKRAHALSVLEKLITKKDVEDVLLDLSGRSRNREKFLEYFNELVNLISMLLRDIMVLKIKDESDFLINVDLKDKLVKLGEYVTIQKILFLIYRMELLFRDIQRNLNIRVLILEFIRYYTQKEVIDV